MIIKSVKLVNWAKSQKRVTIGRIRKEFNVNEERAQVYYDYLKSTGIVGRMGGDEFIVIVENIEELNCQEEIRHFQKIMSEANKAQSGYVYSTAYGYADSSEIVSDGEIRDVNMVYRLADNRMYENKKTCHDARK